MPKKILFNEQARGKIKKGVDIVANAVKSTLGPRGQNVIFESKPTLIITNDGVTIAKEIQLEDKFENLGADLIKEAASRTNEEAGDGTTTAILLVQTMVDEGNRYIATGVNPMIMKEGMKKAGEIVIKELKKIAKPIKTKEEKEQVAVISANGDERIGKLIADILEQVTEKGIVSIEDSNTPDLSYEIVKGMKWDNGFISAYLITDSEKLRAELDNAPIIITTDEITTERQLIPVVEKLIPAGITKFLLIAKTIEAEALQFIVVNRLRGKFHCVAVKAPSFGEYQIDLLDDIACLTNGIVLGQDSQKKLEDIELQDLGKANKVTVTKKETIISGGEGNVVKRCSEIEVLMKEYKDDLFKLEKLKERLGNLVGGVGVIKVGAYSDTEQKEIKYRIEDALNATKAAIAEGIVPGGGVALLRTISMLEKVGFSDKEQAIGLLVVKKALKAPIYQIAQNSGVESSSSIVEKVLNNKSINYGYDARLGKFVNMVEVGIIDPLKVVRNALENAIATAAIILTTNTCITIIDKKL